MAQPHCSPIRWLGDAIPYGSKNALALSLDGRGYSWPTTSGLRAACRQPPPRASVWLPGRRRRVLEAGAPRPAWRRAPAPPALAIPAAAHRLGPRVGLASLLAADEVRAMHSYLLKPVRWLAGRFRPVSR